MHVHTSRSRLCSSALVSTCKDVSRASFDETDLQNPKQQRSVRPCAHTHAHMHARTHARTHTHTHTHTHKNTSYFVLQSSTTQGTVRDNQSNTQPARTFLHIHIHTHAHTCTHTHTRQQIRPTSQGPCFIVSRLSHESTSFGEDSRCFSRALILSLTLLPAVLK